MSSVLASVAINNDKKSLTENTLKKSSRYTQNKQQTGERGTQKGQTSE